MVLTLYSEDNFLDAEKYLRKMRQKYGDSVDSPVARMRYARCFFHCDIDHSLSVMQEILPLLEETHNNKWANACRLDIQFLRYLKGMDTSSIFNGISTIKESIPQFVSLYRSDLRLLAACALVNIKGGADKRALADYCNYHDAYLSESGHRFNKEVAFDNVIGAALAYLKGNHKLMLTLLNTAKTYYQHLGSSYSIPLDHNLSITSIPEPRHRRVEFYNINAPLHQFCFYLDPRMW